MNNPNKRPAYEAAEFVLKRLEAKLVQLQNYKDGCTLDHARTIAEGRIIQVTQDILVLKSAFTFERAASEIPSAV